MEGGENMKKTLKKKMKNTSNAVRYFSTETLTVTITVVDGTCYMVDSIQSCAC